MFTVYCHYDLADCRLTPVVKLDVRDDVKWWLDRNAPGWTLKGFRWGEPDAEKVVVTFAAEEHVLAFEAKWGPVVGEYRRACSACQGTLVGPGTVEHLGGLIPEPCPACGGRTRRVQP